MNGHTSGNPREVLLAAMVLCVGVAVVACSSSGPAPAAAVKPTSSASAPAASSATTAAPSTAAAPASASAVPSAPAAATSPAPAVQPAPSVCGDQKFCYETGDFAATITNFRTSVVSYYRLIDATIRFQNKTDKPLILGYANASGIAVDERGNRYGVGGPNGFRGIGLVNGANYDPRFVIAPASSSDARFELTWAPGPALVGTTFELDMTVNKINTVEGGQHTLGGEFPLTFRGLTNEFAAPAPK